MINGHLIERSAVKIKDQLLTDLDNLLYKHAMIICDNTCLESDEEKYLFKKDIIYELTSIICDHTRRRL